VIANISAWNYPYFVGSNVFVPALAAGNAVLYKPSEFATLTGLKIAEMLHAAGVPDDVFVPVIGGGEIGAALLRQPIDGVFFTGSYATGAKIAASAAKRMIKAQLELGGKDPIYVADDVDVKAAAAAVADGAFYNTGQSCCSVERVYVHRAIAKARSSTRSSPRSRATRPAIRSTRRPTSARSRGGPSSTCSSARSPTRRKKARRCCSAARRSPARATASRRPCWSASTTRWR
jgi:acyl-CoA reductase-like NAD-dependent aldehyde dehydrogenase